MDDSNYNHILSLARDDKDAHKVQLILDEKDSNQNRSVLDPYYGGSLGFENVYKMLDEVCELISKKL